MNSEQTYLYIMGDGDNIRCRIELFLLSNNLHDLSNYSNLSEGSYKFSSGKRQGESADLTSLYTPEKLALLKNIYKRCFEIPGWDYKDIAYADLKKELIRIKKEEPDSILDVTAINKSFIGDIIACCLIEGIQKLYTFDIKVSPNFEEPWKVLFHELCDDVSGKTLYQYTNIVDTPIFSTCSKSILVQTPPIKISIFVAVLLLVALIATRVYFGGNDPYVQSISKTLEVLAAVSGLLSLYLVFFPPRK